MNAAAHGSLLDGLIAWQRAAWRWSRRRPGWLAAFIVVGVAAATAARWVVGDHHVTCYRVAVSAYVPPDRRPATVVDLPPAAPASTYAVVRFALRSVATTWAEAVAQGDEVADAADGVQAALAPREPMPEIVLTATDRARLDRTAPILAEAMRARLVAGVRRRIAAARSQTERQLAALAAFPDRDDTAARAELSSIRDRLNWADAGLERRIHLEPGCGRPRVQSVPPSVASACGAPLGALAWWLVALLASSGRADRETA